MTWHADAACAGQGPDLWFSVERDEQRQAIAICAGCPVSAECLADARASGDSHGIRGGVSLERKYTATPRDCINCGEPFIDGDHPKTRRCFTCRELRRAPANAPRDLCLACQAPLLAKEMRSGIRRCAPCRGK